MQRFQPKATDTGSLLRIARIARNKSQRELAEESGMTQVTISHIESGRSNPHRSTKRLLALTLNYKPSDVFPEDGRSTSKELRALQARDSKQRGRSKP